MEQTLYVTNRKDWRRWLLEHHNKEKKIWLIYFKKHTGKPRIPYDDAVEEAICFGWIDTTVKRIDGLNSQHNNLVTIRHYRSSVMLHKNVIKALVNMVSGVTCSGVSVLAVGHWPGA